MIKPISITVASIAGLMYALIAQADILVMPTGSTPAAPAPLESVSQTLPGRGMTMEQVETRFGAPRERISPVGEPPISRWNYGSFTVYFEHNYVLHSVTHQP